MAEEKHILTMLVDNEPGVLSRIVGLFSGRGFNIESLCVAATIDPKVSRITIVTKANEVLVEQIEKQLRKLINVIKLRDLTGSGSVQREMALICVRSKPENRDEILRMVDIFRCKVVDVGARVLHHRGHRDRRQDEGPGQPAQTHGHQEDRPDRHHRPVQGAPLNRRRHAVGACGVDPLNRSDREYISTCWN